MGFAVSYTVNGQNIHQGPGYPYLNALCPLPGMRALVDSGNPPSLVDPPAPGTWTATTAQTVGALIVDSNGNVQQVTTAGTTAASQPTWNTVIGGTTSDGTVTWTNRGPAYVWKASAAVVVDQEIRDTNNNVQRVVTAGTTGAAAPTWSTTFGGTTLDGTAQWMNLGPTLSLGGLEGSIQVTLAGKFETIGVDQVTAAIDTALTSESATLEITLKELRLDLFSRSVPQAQYSSGVTDTNLPAGAQTVEEVTIGGLVTIPKFCIVVASPRRQFSNPAKNVVATFYKCAAQKDGALGFTRTKASEWKATWEGFAVPWRPVGDQMAKIYRQT